ncbi:hypothetical protein VP1G_02084 [Cytospora mali]|uniref:Uncharacterized protein n=1 Tax=Cytospora mali TaxID=578113 RepID=A0A194UST4_CYTMA|nr:hypothetical protein VP1G_02084 [Valsa mali var. pyri (nom. inval.)]
MSSLYRVNPPYLPGGIPDNIRCHPNPIPRDQLEDDIRGWLVFLDDNSIARPESQESDDDGTYELTQRYRLVSQWASMTQAERDTYQARGTAPAFRRRRRDWRPPPGCFKADDAILDSTRVLINGVNCIAAQPMASSDRAIWTKLRIMLYRLDGEDGPLIDDGCVSVCMPNPASVVDQAGDGVSSGQGFAIWNYLENSDFNRMFMTSVGTVVFYGTDGPRVLVDREALNTGRVLLCEFENNGQLATSCRVRPCILYEFWPLIEGLGKSVQRVMARDVWKSPTYNGP